MAVNDLSRSGDSTFTRVIAFFRDRNDAYRAVSELKEAGFDSDEIGIMYAGRSEIRSAGSDNLETSDHEGFWEKLKNFFSGDSHEKHEDVDYGDSISGMNWDQDRAEYYRSGIERGGALVSVSGADTTEAREILEGAGGELRETGFEGAGNLDTNATSDRDYRIQLRGEILRAYKDRVQRGEVRLRKDVVTENQTIQVPVTREELVIERVPASGSQVSGEIGTDQEIRVPLSEERARVEKQPVVNEEVRVGKRAVQNTQTVSDNVRREELRVDKEGDVDVDSDVTRNRKNPAA